MSEYIKNSISQFLQDFFSNDPELIFLTLLCTVSLVLIKTLINHLRKQDEMLGLSSGKGKTVGLDSSEDTLKKKYLSKIQGLAGEPDAVLLENKSFIPIERKTISNKIRDRHIAQLLVYMRLIAEFEKKEPPYGYLILGKGARKVKIYNTKEKQKWLSNILSEMKKILKGESEPLAKPFPKKCRKCPVEQHCPYSMEGGCKESLVMIGNLSQP